MKYLVVVIVAVFITACAEPGSVNVSTMTPAETDLKITIESTSSKD
tara:strand:+ start:679 stop:816 length:138 start_codon:yes stop_codon:yes gene_type:complete